MSRIKQHLLRWYGQLIICVATGVILGLSVFAIAIQEGWAYFATLGLACGVILFLVLIILNRYKAEYSLTDIKIAPPGLGEVTFTVNKLYKQAAWKIFIECTTRIATQPLNQDSGILREALTSLHNLFTTVRSLLREISPTPLTTGWTVELLAVRLLNDELRPFLSKWHLKLTQHEKTSEETWVHEAAFRQELEDLRIRVIEYAKSFAEISGVEQIDGFFDKNINPDDKSKS